MAANPVSTIPFLHAVEAQTESAREWQIALVGSRLTADAPLRRRLSKEYRVAMHDRAREAVAV